MRLLTLALALVLALPSTSHAITTAQRGAWVDLGAGAGITTWPPQGDLAVALGAGTWWGNYDNAYAAGRFWGVGVLADVHYRSDRLRATPQLEVRRGFDLFVVQTWLGASAGPLLELDADDKLAVGATARANAGLRYRPHRYWAVIGRASLGADLVGTSVRPGAEVLLGIGWSAPGPRSRKANQSPGL